MFIEYLPYQTFIHSLDARTKTLGLIGVTILSFAFDNPLYGIAVVLAVCLLAWSARIPFKKLIGLLVPLTPVFVSIMLLTGFSYAPQRFHLGTSKTVLFYLLPGHHLALTSGGLLTGCTFVIRLFTMVVASSIVSLTTPIEDFIQLLNKLKLPSELSFMITTAIRFIPTMDKKRKAIIDAQKARGAKLNEKGLIGPIKSNIPIMVPMFTNSILMANNLSMSLLNRGFGYTRSRTDLQEMSFRTRDYLSILLIVLATAAGLYVRIWLHRGIL